MSRSDGLLADLLASPTDPARLLVYADWLEEQRDDRAAYARRQLALRQAAPEDRPALLAELRRLYPVDHPAWVGRLEQAGAFAANLLEIREMWWGVGLGERRTDSTYQGFAYAQQPPLPVEQFDGTFAWLRQAPAVVRAEDDSEGWAERIGELREEGYVVPPAFERLMTDSALHERVPSCTDNEFLTSDRCEVHPQGDGAAFVTFYTDSQSCVLWGIRLGRGDDRYAPVLAGPPEHPDVEPDSGPYFQFPDLSWSAPSLEAFVYRWWMENTLWYATKWSARPLSAPEEAYLRHLAGGGK